jgi:hypothetical protein
LQGAMYFGNRKTLVKKITFLFHAPLDFVRGNRIKSAIRNYKFGVKMNIIDSGIGRFPKAIKIKKY